MWSLRMYVKYLKYLGGKILKHKHRHICYANNIHISLILKSKYMKVETEKLVTKQEVS